MLITARFKDAEVDTIFRGVCLIEHAGLNPGSMLIPVLRLHYYNGGDALIPFSCFRSATEEILNQAKK